MIELKDVTITYDRVILDMQQSVFLLTLSLFLEVKVAQEKLHFFTVLLLWIIKVIINISMMENS